MTTSILDHAASPGTTTPKRTPVLARLLQRGLLRVLEGISDGLLTIRDRDRTWQFGLDQSSLRCEVTVHDARFWIALGLGGSVGAGTAYTRGFYDCSDLTALIRIFCRNRDCLMALDGGLVDRITNPLRALLARSQRNTIEGSKRNILAHYDIGNDLYRRMLDPAMQYSSGLYPSAESSLSEAQIAKMDRLCQLLDLGPDDHLLEIGCGWGGLAVHAARTVGCRVTATTISDAQFEYAQQAIANAGLTDRITLLKKDYRSLTGSFDAIVSVEMIEAVGWQFYDTFFRTCRARLKPTGKLVMQAITIADHEYERAKHEVDFIKRCIFPGSCIPSITALSQAASRVSDLRLLSLDDHTPHYARTLADWRQAISAHQDEIRALGYDESFLRLWDFYLSYCEGGFAERAIGTVHLVWAGNDHRQPHHHQLGYAS